MYINALTAVGALMAVIDFTLSNARRFYSSTGNPLAVKGLTTSALTSHSINLVSLTSSSFIIIIILFQCLNVTN